MCDINREFELYVWKNSLTFGLIEGDSFTSTTADFSIPPAKQVSTMFILDGDKSYALPFSPSGLSYDYWVYN